MAFASDNGMTQEKGLAPILPVKERGGIANFEAPLDDMPCHVAAQEKVRILLVDDEAITAQTLNLALTRLGYKVTCFVNSLDALRTFQDHPDQYDLVLTDQKMPDLQGDQLAEQVLRIRPDIPILLCTGFADEISEDESKAKGIREFLAKPFSLEGLAKAMRRVLGDHASLQTPQRKPGPH